MPAELTANPQEQEMKINTHESMGAELELSSSEDLEKFGETVVQDIDSKANEVLSDGQKSFENANQSIRLSEAEANQVAQETGADTQFKSVQEEIARLSQDATDEIAAVIDNENHGNQFKDEITEDQLTELREKTKEDYGDGLVRKYHKGAKTLQEDETAQLKAYEALDAKIETGAVDPSSIGSDMLSSLDLRNKQEITAENAEQIEAFISLELKELTEKGFIKEDEAALIAQEAEKFSSVYAEAYLEANPDKIFQITKDNARKLVYQTWRDKRVFSGSDHGTRHILEGNMTMADMIVESLGDNVSAIDKVLIRQIIIDHDLGYTVGVAQAKKSFDASKDHPLFSAKFIEANQEYYQQKFGQEGYEMIKNGVLLHSYPKSEYGTPTDPKKGFNSDIIRSVTSTVDSLGVTAETKCPAFFREPEAIRVLQKVKLYADIHGGKISDEMMTVYKDQLREIADAEPNETRRQGYYNAIENQFDHNTAEMTLGQYTGVLKGVNIIEKNGKMTPRVSMDVSQVQALLGNLFGDKISIGAFTKAMADFGIPEDVFSDMADTIKKIRTAKTDEEKKSLAASLRYESDKAIFEFAPDFAEINPEIEKVFEEAEKITIRKEIRELAKGLESPEARTPKNVEMLLLRFDTAIRDRADDDDLKRIIELQKEIRASFDGPEEFEIVLKKINTFLTRKEKEFIGIN